MSRTPSTEANSSHDELATVVAPGLSGAGGASVPSMKLGLITNAMNAGAIARANILVLLPVVLLLGVITAGCG
jgi:hypothetical protein